MYYEGNWIHSFPRNFQWSNATLITKGMAPYGAVALGEIDEIVLRLHQRADEPHAWWEEWCAMAARMEKFADQAAAAGHDDRPALPRRGIERQNAQDLRPRDRRLRALPGRQPAGRHR